MVLPVKLVGYLDALQRTIQQEFHQRAFKTPLKLEHLNRKNCNKHQFHAKLVRKSPMLSLNKAIRHMEFALAIQ